MSTFLTAEWRKLIMAQYEVAPEVVAPYLPEGWRQDRERVLSSVWDWRLRDR